MKKLFIILLFPVLAHSQTLHLEDEKIKYKGKFDVHATSDDASQKLSSVLHHLDIKDIRLYEIKSSEGRHSAHVGIRLTSPYPIIRQMNFKMEIEVKDEKFKYNLDDFSMLEKKRGGKKENLSPDDLMDKMEEGGNVAGELERQLNEADLKIHQLLAMIENGLKKNHSTNQDQPK